MRLWKVKVTRQVGEGKYAVLTANQKKPKKESTVGKLKITLCHLCHKQLCDNEMVTKACVAVVGFDRCDG